MPLPVFQHLVGDLVGIVVRMDVLYDEYPRASEIRDVAPVSAVRPTRLSPPTFCGNTLELR